MADLRQSGAYGEWMRTMGWDVVDNLYIKQLPLIGSIIKILRPSGQIPFRKIEEVAKSRRALFVKIEPNVSSHESNLLRQLDDHGYRREKWALIGTKTLRVDLTKSERDVFEQFKKDCRYEIRKAEELNFVIRKNNFESFYRLLRAANKIKGLWTFPKDQFDNLVVAFGQDAFCVEVCKETSLAGCLVLVADRTAYYFLAGSLPSGKGLHAPYLAVWEATKEAKRRNCVLWDFEGLQDNRIPSTASWAGFSHFKRSFGGYEVTFPGTFTKYRNPILKIFSPFA